MVIADSSPDDRARLVTTSYLAGYAGLSVPVLGVGAALQYIEPRVALLVFGAAVAAAAIATFPVLFRRPQRSPGFGLVPPSPRGAWSVTPRASVRSSLMTPRA